MPGQTQHSEIAYSVHGTQPKFQPVSFLVSANQENRQPTTTTYITEEEDRSISINPYQNNASQYRTQPYKSSISPYANESITTTTTSQYTSAPTFTKVCS